MKIVVDTNIIFSLLVNTNSNIGEIFFNSGELFEFYSCRYMIREIDKHRQKLMKISKLTESEMEAVKEKVLANISFINEKSISSKIWKASEKLVTDIDIDDIDFVALTKHLRGKLWTGDKKLLNGLRKKNFKPVVSTDDLLLLRK